MRCFCSASQIHVVGPLDLPCKIHESVCFIKLDRRLYDKRSTFYLLDILSRVCLIDFMMDLKYFIIIRGITLLETKDIFDGRSS